MKIIVALLLVACPFLGSSQTILNKLKQKVKDRVEQRTDEGMDKAIDKAEEKAREKAKEKAKDKSSSSKEEKPNGEKGHEKATAKEKSANEDVKPTAAPVLFDSYSQYDFVPGEEIVYTEDFSQDVVGEFPLNWSTNTRGEVETIKGIDGKWMRMYEGRFVSPYIKSMPDNFTAEFDVVIHLPENVNNTSYPEFNMRLFTLEAGDERAKKYFNNNYTTKADTRLVLVPYTDENSTIRVESTEEGAGYFNNENKYLPGLRKYLDKPMHIAIWVQKERLRFWINGEKVYDLPQAVPFNKRVNRMEIEVGDFSYPDIGYFISNIRFAKTPPDMRSKLISEGKLVTTGILFDVNSDKIKPESFGVLQEIAKVLKDNAGVKVKIIGHTDSDGDDGKNLDLSKRRAAAVKQALSTTFSIEASRMETDGKGESEPVADNNMKEGKAKNRRVEFIKQ